MTEDNEQAVAEQTDDQAKPETEDNGAQDDLDRFLAEYDEEVGSEKESEQKPDSEDSDLRKQVEALERRQAQEAYRKDMDETVKAVRGEVDPGFMDDDTVEAWLDARARKEPRLQKAWQQRHSNPKGWEKVVKGLNKEFNDRFSNLPDRNATEDREAVAAAVRGQSTRAPDSEPAPDFKGKSNHEYREEVYQKYGYRPQT